MFEPLRENRVPPPTPAELLPLVKVVAVLYGLSPAAEERACFSALRDPVRARACYQAILNSFGIVMQPEPAYKGPL